MRVSLSCKLSLLIVILLSVVIVVVSFSTITTFKKSGETLSNTVSSDVSQALYNQLTSRAASFAEILAEGLTNPLYHYDMELIYRTLRSALIQPDIRTVILFDAECKVVHDGIEEIPSSGSIFDSKEHCIDRAHDQLVTSRSDNSIIASELIQYGNQILGGISVEISLEEAQENLTHLESLFEQREKEGLRTHLRRIIVISVTILLISLIAVWLFSRRLTRPIRILSEHAQRVGNGDYGHMLTTDRNDEIGDLITSFEQMRRDLNSSTVSIEQLQDKIDEKVKAEEQRNKMEEQLRRAQRMEAIGQLSAGIAHDLNNILSGIVTYPQLLMMDLPENSPLRRPLQSIHKSGNRAALIVQDMLSLARCSMNLDEIIDPEDLLRRYINSPESMKMLQTHPGVKIKLSCSGDTFNIKGSQVHLQKVFMNLINNAVDAIEAQGELTVALENVYVDRPFGTYESIAEGDYVRFSFIDSGTGIAPDDLPHIFESFYTKKVMGRSGTGLGMAIVWNTVKDHKGYIHIESEPRVGTTVLLYLPVTSDVVKQENTDTKLASYMGNKEKILIVDDVAVQRQIATSILQKLNYQVESVAGGLEALYFLEKRSVDLIILDMVMEPGISGLETCQRIFPTYPDALIIIVSGFSEEGMVDQALSLGAKAFLNKPYSVNALGATVKNTLQNL